MADIIFYKNSSDRRCLNKKLSDPITLDNIKLNTEMSTETFEFDINTQADPFDVDVYNYCYSSWQPGYYYVTFTRVSYRVVHAVATIDPLMTYASSIKKIVATIDRNENEKNGYLLDSQYSAYAYKQVTTKTFPRGMTDDSIILMTIG